MTASVRLATPNLDRMLLTWDLTVEGLTVSLPAICVLFKPSTIRVRTSRSRSVRSKPGTGGWEAACDQRLGGLGRKSGAAGMRSADGLGKFLCRDILEQITDRSGFQRVPDQSPLFEAGQRNDLYLWKLLADERVLRLLHPYPA